MNVMLHICITFRENLDQHSSAIYVETISYVLLHTLVTVSLVPQALLMQVGIDSYRVALLF